MIITAETISAVVRSQTGPRQPSGFGRIVTTDNATWLQTGTERIPIDLPPGNNLRNGTMVRYDISGNVLSITPTATQKNSEFPAVTDTFNPLPNPLTTTVATTSRTEPFFTVAMPPGLYLITDISKATELLGDMDDNLLRQLRTLIAEDGVAAVKIETASATTSRIFLLKVSDISLALQTLRTSFASASLASVPIEVLRQVLFDRGDLPFSAVAELDHALPTESIPFANARAGSVTAQNSALAQWLLAALSHEKMPLLVAPLAPLAPASIVMTECERMLPSISAANGKLPADPEVFGLTRASIEPSADGTDPITAAARRMGFTLEHSLVNNRQATQTGTPDQTLKGLLLNLSAHPLPDGSRTEPRLQPMPGHTTESLPVFGEYKDPAIISDRKPALPERLYELYRELVHLIRREVPQVNIPTSGNRTTEVPSATTPQQQPIVPDATQTETVVPLVKISGRIAELLTTARALSALPPLPAELLQQPEMSVPRAEIATLLTKLTEISDSLTGTVSGLPTPSDLTPAIPHIRSALATIEALVQLIRNMPEPAFTAAETPAPDRDRATISHQPERSTSTAPLQNSIFSRVIDAALDRLESLQLLARQTATTQGTQQIIALPIKFGETWTEINVRFMHHKQRKSSKTSTHFSAVIDVAPATLGAISAHLDYRTSRQLQVTIEFERPSTRDWFAGHKGELQSDLARGAAAAVSIDLRQKRKQTSPSTTALRSNSGTIDMTG